VREGERKEWEEKRREGKEGREREGTAMESKNVLPHSKQAVAAYEYKFSRVLKSDTKLSVI